MADTNKWAPSDMLEPIKRFLDGDLAVSPTIKVEQFQDGSTLVVRAEVPGIDPDKDVDVSVSDGMLHIKAEREEKAEHRARPATGPSSATALSAAASRCRREPGKKTSRPPTRTASWKYAPPLPAPPAAESTRKIRIDHS